MYTCSAVVAPSLFFFFFFFFSFLLLARNRKRVSIIALFLWVRKGSVYMVTRFMYLAIGDSGKEANE
jgi:hypothetical protein